MTSKKYLSPPLKDVENLLFPPILQKHQSLFQTSDMLLILGSKKIYIMKEFGNGRKVGAAGLWQNKDLAERVAQFMVIVTDFIPLPCMQILWRSILFHKYVNFLWMVCCFNLKPLEFQTFSPFHFRQLLSKIKLRILSILCSKLKLLTE